MQLLNPVNLAISGSGKATGTILDDDKETANKKDETNGNQENAKTRAITANCSLKITPNPTSNIVHLEVSGYSGNVTIEVSNIQGKILRQKQMQASAKFAQQQLDLTEFPDGTYLITVFDNNGNKNTKQVVVVH